MTIRSIVVVALIGALAVWVKSRWRAWFNNVPEVEYAVAQSPDRITLTPGADFASERTVSWRCGDSVRHAFLQLAHCGDTATVDAEGCVVESRAGCDAFYSARISGLAPDESYSYRAVTDGRASEWYTFRMPDGSRRRRFVYFGDVQDTIGGHSHEWFAKLYGQFADADFWACAGDLIEAPVDSYWSYLYSSTDSILATMPIVNAAGNHDYIKSLYLTIDPRWEHNFVYPENGAATARGKSYYFDTPQMRFIVLDTNGVQDIVSAMGETQWLESALQGAGSRWKVVMMHHPIHSVRKGRNNVVIRNAFRPLLERYGVHIVLQGHEHGYMRTCAEGGKPVYVVSFMSPKSYQARNATDGVKIVPDTRTYQIIDYDDTMMRYRSFALDTDSIIDEFSIAI